MTRFKFGKTSLFCFLGLQLAGCFGLPPDPVEGFWCPRMMLAVRESGGSEMISKTVWDSLGVRIDIRVLNRMKENYHYDSRKMTVLVYSTPRSVSPRVTILSDSIGFFVEGESQRLSNISRDRSRSLDCQRFKLEFDLTLEAGGAIQFGNDALQCYVDLTHALYVDSIELMSDRVYFRMPLDTMKCE